MQDLRVTLIQTELDWKDHNANYERFQSRIVSIENTDLVVLPEAFITGFIMDPTGSAEDFEKHETLNKMRQWSSRGFAVCGSVFVYENGNYYNRLLFVEPDGSYHSYDKRHLFRMAGEHESFTGGKKRVFVEYKGWKIALFVCYDLRFPVWSRNDAEYDLGIYVANWPAARRHPWRTLLRARAIENQCYIVGLNRIGLDGNEIEYCGDSAVIDPKGEDIADLGDQEIIQHAVLSKASLEEFRKKFPVSLDADSFTINL